MLLSAPDEVARTKAIDLGAGMDERLGQVASHEPVRARHQAGPTGERVGELAANLVQRRLVPGMVVPRHRGQ